MTFCKSRIAPVIALFLVTAFAGSGSEAREFERKKIKAKLTYSTLSGGTRKLGTARAEIRYSDDRSVCKLAVGETQVDCRVEWGRNDSFIALDQANMDLLLSSIAHDHFSEHERPAVSETKIVARERNRETVQLHTADPNESYHLTLIGKASHAY